MGGEHTWSGAIGTQLLPLYLLFAPRDVLDVEVKDENESEQVERHVDGLEGRDLQPTDEQREDKRSINKVYARGSSW